MSDTPNDGIKGYPYVEMDLSNIHLMAPDSSFEASRSEIEGLRNIDRYFFELAKKNDYVNYLLDTTRKHGKDEILTTDIDKEGRTEISGLVGMTDIIFQNKCDLLEQLTDFFCVFSPQMTDVTDKIDLQLDIATEISMVIELMPVHISDYISRVNSLQRYLERVMSTYNETKKRILQLGAEVEAFKFPYEWEWECEEHKGNKQWKKKSIEKIIADNASTDDEVVLPTVGQTSNERNTEIDGKPHKSQKYVTPDEPSHSDGANDDLSLKISSRHRSSD